METRNVSFSESSLRRAFFFQSLTVIQLIVLYRAEASRRIVRVEFHARVALEEYLNYFSLVFFSAGGYRDVMSC